MISKGFHGESKVIYNLTKENSRYYLSDWQRLKTRFINGEYTFLLNNKVVFERLFGNDIKIPKTLSLIEKGKIVPIDNVIEDVESLLDYIKINSKAVMKPINGGGGAGIIILKYSGSEIYSNNQKINKEELIKLIKKLDDYFICEYVEQAEFIRNLYPESLNTMRIVTMIDPATNKAFIPIAVQRIGTKKSSPADNWTQGGISAEIDLNTGIIGKGATYPINGRMEWLEKHPDTGYQFSGVRIPHWQEIKNEILKMAEKHPYIKYVGWDVVLTNNGITIIEGNTYSGVNILQIHRPLLKDVKVKEFYKYHNVL